MAFKTAGACYLFALLVVGPLSGCAAVVIAGIPITFFTTEVVPRAVNGKGLVEDGVDVVTGKDCRVIEGTLRDDRKLCEKRGSVATKKDFKGLSGLLPDEEKKDAAAH